LTSEKDEARSRSRYFFYIFGGAFIYAFIPQYMFPLLGGFSIFCLAKDDSVWFTRLFGGTNVNEGLGILSLSFDWNFLSTYTPMVLPLWVQLNIYCGILLLWIVGPLLWYYDVWDAQSFRFLSNGIFAMNQTTHLGYTYPQKEVLNPDNSLNYDKLAEIGIPQYSAVLAFSYILINFGVTASISHVALFYGKQIWATVRSAKSQFTGENADIHNQLMRSYKEVSSDKEKDTANKNVWFTNAIWFRSLPGGTISSLFSVLPSTLASLMQIIVCCLLGVSSLPWFYPHSCLSP
jgi:hypothetical protein